MTCAGLVVLFSLQVQAQHYLYECKRVLIDPTLNSNEITGVVRDGYGMVWLGSFHGLYRFDGYNTDRIIFNEPSSSAHGSRINSIACWENRVYLATNEGLFSFDCFNHQSQQIGDNNPVRAVFADSRSGVWWVDQNGKLYNLHKNKTRSVALPVVSPAGSALVCSDSDRIWISFSNFQLNQLFAVDKAALHIQSISLTKTKGKFIGNLRVSDAGNVRLLSIPKSFEWNPVAQQLNEITAYGSDVFDLLQSGQGSFAVKGENRIVHHYLKNGNEYEINIDLGAVKPEKITSLYDVNQCIFAETTNGLLIIKVQQNLFDNLFSTYDPASKAFLVPRGIAEDSSHIYLGTYNKLVAYDKLRHTPKIIQELSINTRSLLADQDTLWMATEGAGLKKFILSSGRMLPTATQPELASNFMFCLARLDAGHLLIGGAKHLMLYDKQRDRFDEIRLSNAGQQLGESRVNQIIPAGPDKWWVATGNGIYCINARGNILYNYAATLQSLKELNTFAMLINDDESVWAGTADGILLIDKNGTVKKRITKAEGLAGNMVISLIRDHWQNIWAASYTGLSCYNPGNGTIKNFYKEQGLPDNEFNHSSFCLLKNGHLVLGSVNGFIEFNPADLSELKPEPLNIVISKVEYGNFEHKLTDLTRERCNQLPIRLGKDIQFIKLFFSTQPSATFQNLTYEFKIEGIHPEWISLGTSPFLHLDNFKPGNYNLRVRAIGASGNEQLATVVYPLVVEQYFYNSPAFYLILFAVIVTLILLYLFAVIKRNKKITEIRQTIAQDLHDELGGYLTGISMNVELMRQNRNKEQQYAETITSLGQKALRSLKDSLWSLDIRSDNAQQLWDRVKELTADLYETLDIDFRFEQPEGLEKIRLSVLEKNYLLFIIKECLHNSIRYGDRQMVQLSWIKAGSGHQIVISNTKGESTRMKGTGRGMYNIQNRMKKIKGSAEFESANGIFTVRLYLNFIS